MFPFTSVYVPRGTTLEGYMMAGELERIFSLLLSPDTETIRQGTAELQALYKNPILLDGLCHVILNSENPHIRQLSAVVLRKKLVQVWRQLSQEDRESLKNVFVQCLSSEMHHLVLRAAANLVSVIANFEFTHNQWPELSVFIMQNCQNDDPVRQEIGMLVLSSVMEAAAFQLHPQYIQLLTLFSSALSNERNKMVPYYALKSLTSMIEYLKEDEMPHFRALIPKTLQAIKALISEDENKACNAMELFEELMECDINLISPFIRQLVEFCLEIGNDPNLDEPIRVKALSTLGFLASVKKKALLKLNLLSSILQTTLSIMATAQNDDPDEDDDDILSDHTHSPQAEASRVLDQLALNLPPEKMFTSVLGYIQPWLQNECLPLQKRAALTAIGVISEGCAEYIRKTHLSGLVQFIYSGLEHPDQHVKNAALFSLGQFSEHLQPEISQFSSDLLPALFQFLDHALASSGCDGPSINRTFYAVEMFCENLGADLLPYLPVLMDKLFLLLTGDYNFNCKELAISCIGAIANAVGVGLVPYFQKILESLKMYLVLPYQQDMIVLQAQAVDTLGTMARTMGVSNFRPIAEECVQLGISLMTSGDPDLRRSVYGMLASVSKVLRQDMVKHLPTIIPRMIESLSCDEGVQAYYSSYAVPFLDFDDEPGGDESIDSLEDDQDIEGYTVENAYIEEKEDTCNAIAEIAENVGILFLPYIDDCFKEIRTLVDHSAISIRKASIMSLGRLCIVWYHPVIIAGYNEEEKTSLNMLINFTLNNMSASARTDSVSTVVLATLESIEIVLKGLKGCGCVLEHAVVESLVVTVEDILNNKAQCQEDDGEGTTFEFQNSDVAEIDGLLLETAGSIIGPLATVVGGANIIKLLNPIIELLMNKLTHDSSVATRSFVIGTFAEIVDGCGSASSELAGNLYPLFAQGMRDKSDEVASNSVYGMGTLAANALPEMTSQYPEILSVLFGLAQTRHNGRLMDNICAAVCRMITSQQDRVPLEQVLPVLLQNLPLKEDMEENETVYKCIFNLLSTGNIVIMNNLDLVLKSFAAELSSDKLSSDLRSQMIQILHALHVQCSQQFEAAIACLPPGHTQVLAETLASQTGLPNTNDNI